MPGAPGVTFTPEQELGVQIAVKSEFDKSGRGTVKMTPQVKVLRSGQETVLSANPLSGSEFAGWRYPDGHIEDGEPRLTLDATCQAGVYRAVFRRRKGKGGNRQRRRFGVRNDAPDADRKVK